MSGGDRVVTETVVSGGRYGVVARTLHWLIAALIVTQFLIAEMAEEAAEAAGGALSAQLALYANHKSLGMLVLLLAVVRVGWRMLVPPPAPPTGMPLWQLRASRVAHITLYVLIFAMPLSGWLHSSAANYSVSFFGLFTWPDLVGPSKFLEDLLESVHELCAKLLLATAGVHVAAALKHALVDRDGVWQRMASWPAVGGALLLALALVYMFGVRFQPGEAAGGEVPVDAAPAAGPAAAGPARDVSRKSNLPAWSIDYAASHIEFTGQQAGAPFHGRWQSFEADIHFDPDRLDESHARVRIDTRSNSTGDVERDEVMRGSDWFDVDNWPDAEFVAEDFRVEDGAWLADATLRLRDVTRPLPLRFTVTTENGHRVLRGTARIDRLAFALGRGEWLDTTWVGRYVDVDVSVVTMP